MQLHSLETFEIIRKPRCTSSHPFCMKLDNGWESSLKIMFNDTFGINNLRSSKPLLRCSWTSIWLSITICLLLLALDVDARPATLREHARHNIRMPSIAAGSSGSPKSFNVNMNSSSDNLSLSIFSPLDILRQNMLLEIQRKRLRHAKQRQVQSNKEFLDRIGR